MMAHHKWHRPKSQRAGCLFCKPWKAECTAKIERFKPSEKRKLQKDER